jgi:hypothetical protein
MQAEEIVIGPTERHRLIAPRRKEPLRVSQALSPALGRNVIRASGVKPV